MGRHSTCLFGALLVVALGASAGLATTIDLTDGPGTSGVANGGYFEFYDFQAAGTGVLEPFVRIQHNGTEEGYNTSAEDLPFDEKPGPWTHDLLLSDVPIVYSNGGAFLEFILDINEAAPASQRLLSLDRILIFTSPIGSQNTTDLPSLGALRFDLDGAGDSYIIMDYTNAVGSGETDLRALIPLDSFAGAAPTDYLYFYSQFGTNHASNAGFEEWNVVAIPEPGSAVLTLLALVSLIRRRRGT
jgi:hypothetical protein